MDNEPNPSQWMTYADAAELLGIDPDSVKRTAQRKGWERMPGNDGKTRVAVPLSAIPEPKEAKETPPALAALLEGLVARAIAAEVRAATAEATVAAQAKELRRWVRRAPTQHVGVVLRRLDKMAGIKPTEH